MKKHLQIAQLVVSTASAVLTLILIIFAILEFGDIDRRFKQQSAREVGQSVRDAKDDETASLASRSEREQGEIENQVQESAEQPATQLPPTLGPDWLNSVLRPSSLAGQCAYEGDGECDAVGFLGSTNLCPSNTDVQDCSDVQPLRAGQICIFEDDGECDAVGYSPSTGLCPADTDQSDCQHSNRTTVSGAPVSGAR